MKKLCNHGEVVCDVSRGMIICRKCGASARLPEREEPRKGGTNG